MGENTAIEWADHTMNFWKGCTEVSPGCDHCYARELMDTRYHQAKWGVHETRIRTSVANWRKPYQWDRQAAAQGRRFRVFTLSVGDFFDAEVRESMRRDAWAVIRDTPNLDWLILTKRPNIIPRYLPDDWGDGWPHVALGTSVETQAYTWRVEKLLAVPAKMRFLSCEPLLGPVDLSEWLVPSVHIRQHGPMATETLDALGRMVEAAFHAFGGPGLHWVIAGGESGPNARPMHPDWSRSLRDQCVAAGVPFFFKQWGGYAPVQPGFSQRNPERFRWVYPDGHVELVNFDPNRRALTPDAQLLERVGKHNAGRTLDGETWDQYPEVRSCAS